MTNTLSPPPSPLTPSASPILPLTFFTPRPHPSTPWFPLSHFISLHLRLQFPLAPSLNRTVCLFNGLHLPLTPLNLLSTAWEVAIWKGFLFFLKIVGKEKNWNISISVNTFQIKRFIFVQNKYSWWSSSQTRWADRNSGSSCYFLSDQSHDSITIGEVCWRGGTHNFSRWALSSCWKSHKLYRTNSVCWRFKQQLSTVCVWWSLNLKYMNRCSWTKHWGAKRTSLNTFCCRHSQHNQTDDSRYW